MRLHRLTLRGFRGIHDKTVEFAAAGVTVLQGRNEAGKSTFMEALRFLRIHKAGSKRAEMVFWGQHGQVCTMMIIGNKRWRKW